MVSTLQRKRLRVANFDDLLELKILTFIDEWNVEAGPMFFDETVTGVQKAIEQAGKAIQDRGAEPLGLDGRGTPADERVQHDAAAPVHRLLNHGLHLSRLAHVAK